jgi:hypothetical protein
MLLHDNGQAHDNDPYSRDAPQPIGLVLGLSVFASEGYRLALGSSLNSLQRLESFLAIAPTTLGFSHTFSN